MQRVRKSQILDANGNNIEVTEALSDEQVSKLGYIAKEYGSHPSGGLTPLRLSNILRNAEQGNLVEQNDLFEDMEEKDGHIFADMSKRKRAIMGLDWQMELPRNATAQEKNAAGQITEWLDDMRHLKTNIFNMADAIGKCYSMHSIQWQEYGKIRLPKLNHQESRLFTIDDDDRNKLLMRSNAGKGEELWEFGWVSHIHKAKSGSIARGGLYRILAWPFIFKNYSIRDLAEFLEIYGIPLRTGKYPAGASDNEKSTLLRAVIGIGHNSAGIMPEGMEIDFHEAAKGQSDPFKFMIEWCESVQSKIILGGTLTSTAENTGLGSNLGDIHNEIRKDLLVSDAEQIAETINRDLIWPMIALNIPGISPDRAPRFEFVTEESEELNQRAARDKDLYEIGIRLKADKVSEIYGDEYELVKIKTTNDSPSGNEQAALVAAKAGDDDNELDGVVDRLGVETQDQVDQLYTKIKQLLDDVAESGGTMQDFSDRLVEAFGFLDPEELADVIQMGLATAEVAGRYEVSDNA